MWSMGETIRCEIFGYPDNVPRSHSVCAFFSLAIRSVGAMPDPALRYQCPAGFTVATVGPGNKGVAMDYEEFAGSVHFSVAVGLMGSALWKTIPASLGWEESERTKARPSKQGRSCRNLGRGRPTDRGPRGSAV